MLGAYLILFALPVAVFGLSVLLYFLTRERVE
jgi:hypothetical protein